MQFEYDRYGKFDELSSCWIRVSQGWAGTKFGGMAIPRIGQEVIVNYLEGDPDQPIVTGRTFNANNLPPYPLPANKTRMTIKSNTHKGSGFNELRFEDEKDQQEVFIHAEKDQNNIVKNNETTKVGVDRSEDIGQNETISIGKDRSENVGNDETISIGHDRRENVGRDESASIGKNQSNTIGNTQQNDIGKNKITKIGKDEMTNIANSRVLDVYADQKIKSGGHYSHTVGGKTTWKSGENIQHLTTVHEITGTQKAIIKAPGGTIILDAGGITLKGAVNIKGNLAIIGGSPEAVESINIMLNTGKPVTELNFFDEAMLALNEKTGMGLIDYPYLIETPEGKKIFGRTDENGKIPRFLTGSISKKLKIYFGDEALYRKDLKQENK